jgi:uncharacterized DUF497 family protein
VRYEWDERKDIENQRRHGAIAFDMASLVFEDPCCIIGPDRIDETGERRRHAIGVVSAKAHSAVILLVVHAYRETSNGEEVIRIFPARKANQQDARRYREQEMD